MIMAYTASPHTSLLEISVLPAAATQGTAPCTLLCSGHCILTLVLRIRTIRTDSCGAQPVQAAVLSRVRRDAAEHTDVCQYSHAWRSHQTIPTRRSGRSIQMDLQPDLPPRYPPTIHTPSRTMSILYHDPTCLVRPLLLCFPGSLVCIVYLTPPSCRSMNAHGPLTICAVHHCATVSRQRGGAWSGGIYMPTPSPLCRALCCDFLDASPSVLTPFLVNLSLYRRTTTVIISVCSRATIVFQSNRDF